jgi:hypothetical protein
MLTPSGKSKMKNSYFVFFAAHLSVKSIKYNVFNSTEY